MGQFLQGLFGKANPQIEDVDRSIAYPVFGGEYNQVGYRGGPDASQGQLDDIAMQVSWVFSGIKLISNRVAAADYQVVERRGEHIEPSIDHPLERIMRKPNPFMGGAYLKAYTSWWFSLRGEAAWLLIPDNTGELTEIWPLPADRIIPIEDAQDYVAGYAYYPRYNTHEPIVLEREEVCFFKFPNPKNYRRGMSPLTGITSAIETDILSSRWNINTFKNEATLRQLISLPPTLQNQKFRALRHEILEELGKGKRFMVVRGGDVNVDSIGLTQKDVEFLGAREISRTEIDRAYGIPEGYWSAQATRSNAEAARLALAEDAIIPILRLWGGDIDSQIIDCYYTGQTITSHWEDVRPKDQKVEIAKQKLVYDSMTVNEVRIAEGKPEMETAWGDLPWALRNSPNALQFVMAREITLEGTIDELDTASQPNPEPPDDKSGIGEPREPRGTDVGNTDPEGTSEPAAEQKATQLDNLLNLARTAELKQWKAVSLRMAHKGKSPLDYPFETSAVSDGEAAFIRQMFLFGATTKHAVKSLFNDFDDFYGKANVGAVLAGDDYPIPDDVARAYYNEVDGLITQLEEETIDRDSFVNRVTIAARNAIIAAYLLGAGVDTYDDLSLDDREAIEKSVDIHEKSAESLADDISAGVYNPEQNPNAVQSKDSRLALWLLALSGVFAVSQLSGGEDDDLVGWQYGPTDHCEDCVRLNGQVHTRKAWRESGWHPRAFHLACHGYWCQCRWTFGHTADEETGGF